MSHTTLEDYGVLSNRLVRGCNGALKFITARCMGTSTLHLYEYLRKLWFVSYCLQQYLVVSITANAGYVSQVSQTEKTGEDGKGKYLGHLYLSSIQQKNTIYDRIPRYNER